MNFEKVISFLHTEHHEMVALERILTAVPALAPESGGDGEEKKAAILVEWLKAHGISDITRIDAPDSRVSCGFRPSIIASIPGADNDADAPSYWIISHLDVVPPGERSLWHSDPWNLVEKDGRIYGRGVEDNQQGLVSSIFAVLALRNAGITPRHTVKLLFVADEECGSRYGMEYILNHENLFLSQDIAVIPDGGDALGETIEIAEKNIFWIRFTVSGRQSHGSRPDQGCNAFLAGSALALRMHEMETVFDARNPLFEPPYSTIQPTKKEANVPNINTIPGEDIFCMDMRILPCYTLDQVRSEIKLRADAISKEYGVTVTWTEEQSGESPATPAESPAVRDLAVAIKSVTGRTARTIGIGGGTVGACLRSHGFLNTVIWSMLDDTAHQPDEYAVIQNIIEESTVLASLLCGYTGNVSD